MIGKVISSRKCRLDSRPIRVGSFEPEAKLVGARIFLLQKAQFLEQQQRCGLSISGATPRVSKSKWKALCGRTRLLAILLIGFTSCVQYHRYPIVKPIAPAAKHGLRVERVDSLQPTLSWQLSKGPPALDTTYDLVIYEAERARDYYSPVGWIEKQLVYRRDGLKEAEHRVEISLKPATYYIWAIRYHQGGKVSDWSTYTYNSTWIAPGVGGATGSSNEKNQPFVFSTPAR